MSSPPNLSGGDLIEAAKGEGSSTTQTPVKALPIANGATSEAKPRRYTIPKIPTKGQLSLKLPIEEKNLILIHNMDSTKLHQVAETGVASPSIAIVHKDKGFTSFGDISLLVHPSKVNPRNTPVYDRDVFTPTFKATVSKIGQLDRDKWAGFKKEVHAAVDRASKKEHGGVVDPVLDQRHEKVTEQLETPIFNVLNTGMSEPESYKINGHIQALINHLPKSVVEELGEKKLDSFDEPYTNFDNLRGKIKNLFVNKKYAQFKDGTKIELTPENEKAILRKIRPGTIKGGEYGGLKSAYYRKEGNEDEALDIHAAKRLKSFADIRQKAKEKLVTSGQGKYTMVPMGKISKQDAVSATVGGPKYNYDRNAIYRAALKAVEKGTPISEYISRHGLKEINGSRVEPEEAMRVGQILDKWWNKKKNEKTEYFEAKPQKFFRLNDFSAAVVPHSEFDNLKDYFAQHGVHAVPYRDGEERKRLVQELALEHKLMLSEKDLGLEELVKAELVEELEDELQLEELYKAAEELDLEDLEKGAMARLFPFDPAKEANRETGGFAGNTMGKDLDRWTGEEDHKARVRISQSVSPEITQRSLHKLHGLTQVRRGPHGREFLLHRGHLLAEPGSKKGPSHYFGGAPTSWTPNVKVATDIFGSAKDEPRTVTSAWIPEQSIKTYIPQMGDVENLKKPRGPSTWKNEQEVLVGPGKFELHQPGLAKGEPPGLIDDVNDFSEEDKKPVEELFPVVLTLISDGLGKMVFIKRADSGKWSVCAGHIEVGETAEEAAKREVFEETGLQPEYLSRIYESMNPNLTCFSCQVQGIPHGRNDPDNEGKASWIDITRGVPANIFDNLAGPEDETNVVRQLFQKDFSLKKSQYNWLDAGFLDLSKKEPDSTHIPLATTQKAPKKLSVVHQPKEKEQKNLLVVHNLTQDNLQHAHELGGLAAPSIAIHHKDHPFDSYGDVTLVAHPSLIDPEKGVPVFNADAYTARHPRPNYKINKPKFKALVQELHPHAKTVGETNHLQNLEEEIERRGVREAIESRSFSPTLKAAYLHEKGHAVTPLLKDRTVTHEIVKEQPMQDFFLQHGYGAGGTMGDSPHIYPDDTEYLKNMTEAYKKAIATHVASQIKDLSPKDAKHIKKITIEDHLNRLDEDGVLSHWQANKLADSHQAIGKQEPDRWGTQEAVDSKLKELGLESDYERWAVNKVKPAQSTPYIPVGARKQPYTIENVLRHVTGKGVSGTEDSGSTHGTGFARAKGATRYSNLEHIKGDQGSLVNHEEFNKWRDESTKKFGVIADKLDRYSDAKGFQVMDSLSNALGESLKPGHNLRTELVKDGFKGVPDSLVKELEQWGKELKYGPTEYFEAKPQRAVNIGEFKGAAVPHDVRPETLDLLKQYGVNNIQHYKRSDANDRLRAVNQVADAQDLRLSESDLGLEPLVKTEE